MADSELNETGITESDPKSQLSPKLVIESDCMMSTQEVEISHSHAIAIATSRSRPTNLISQVRNNTRYARLIINFFLGLGRNGDNEGVPN